MARSTKTRTRSKKNGNDAAAATNDQVGTEAAPPAPTNDAAAALAAGAVRKAGRRGRPRQARPVLSNVTDEQIAQRYREFAGIKAEQEKLGDKLKAFNKLIKSQGIDPADMAWRYKQTKRDPAEIDAETRRRNRVAVCTALPLGTQLGLLDGQPTVDGNPQISVATAIEDRKMANGSPTMEQTEHEAEIGGAKAVDIGKKLDENPWPADHPNHEPWRRGFVKRVEERGEPLPEGATAEDASTDFPRDLAKADEGGFKHAGLGAEITANPWPKGTPRHNAWNTGWRRFTAEKAGAGTPQTGRDASAVTH